MNKGPTSLMMESAHMLEQTNKDGEIKRSDLDKIRHKMGKYVHSLPSERRMNHT